MRIPVRFLLVSALLLPLAGCLGMGSRISRTTVHLAPAAQPRYAKGDRFVYRTEKGTRAIREVVATTPDGTEWVTETGYRFRKDADIFVPRLAWQGRSSRGRALHLSRQGALWPLAARNEEFLTIDYERTDLRNGQVRRYQEFWRCRAGTPRRVRVPAGEFDTYKVVCKRRELETGKVTRTHIWYYAPRVGHYVLRIKKYANGRRKELALIEWKRGGEPAGPSS